MTWFGRITSRSVVIGVGMVLLAFPCGRMGVAFQRNQPVPVPIPPDYSGLGGRPTSSQPRQSPFDEQAVHEMEEKRGKVLSAERQRLMVKEANQLVQVAAELQAGVTEEVPGMGREEQARRAELVEKLAKNVKERMRGTR